MRPTATPSLRERIDGRAPGSRSALRQPHRSRDNATGVERGWSAVVGHPCVVTRVHWIRDRRAPASASPQSRRRRGTVSLEFAALAHAVAPIEVVQHQWAVPHHPLASESARRWCAEVGAAFLAWSPLAPGSSSMGSTRTPPLLAICDAVCRGRRATGRSGSPPFGRRRRPPDARCAATRWHGQPRRRARSLAPAPLTKPAPESSAPRRPSR